MRASGCHWVRLWLGMVVGSWLQTTSRRRFNATTGCICPPKAGYVEANRLEDLLLMPTRWHTFGGVGVSCCRDQNLSFSPRPRPNSQRDGFCEWHENQHRPVPLTATVHRLSCRKAPQIGCGWFGAPPSPIG